MNKSNFTRMITILTFFLIIQGCSQGTPALTSSPTPSPTSAPTLTPTPYPTLRPKSVSDEVRNAYFEPVGPILKEWEEANLLMADRGSGGLGPIIRLEEIRIEFAELERDPYFDEVHAQMVLHMDCQIAAYVALMIPRDQIPVDYMGEAFEFLEEVEVIFGRCSFPDAD